MASNYGNLEHGAGVIQGSDGTFVPTSKTTPGALGAGDRGEPSGNLGFLHTYPITMFLGVVLAFLTVAYFGKRMKYSGDTLYILVMIIVPTSIVGARAGFLIASGSNSDGSHGYVLSGLSIQGGVMFSAICASIFLGTQRHHIDFRTAFGIILPSVIIGQAIGRGGNFDNHEVYGAAVDGAKLNGLTFIKPHMLIRDLNNGTIGYRQPFFFYESMLNLLGYLLFVGVLLRKNGVKPGVTGALYLSYYGITRLIMEPLRDPVDIMKINGFPTSVLIAALGIVVGLFFFVGYQGLTRPFDKGAKMIFPKLLLNKFHKEYEVITPVKPRRKFFFGETVETKGLILINGGKQVPNKVKLYIPVRNQEKGSKKELNQGFKNKKK